MTKTTSFCVKIHRQKQTIILKEHSNLQSLDVHTKQKLLIEIHYLLTSVWGTFPNDFVEVHIFNAYKIYIAYIGERCVGLNVVSLRTLAGVMIFYSEFLAIDKDYQNSSLGSYLFFIGIKDELLKRIYDLLSGTPLEVFFITPNIRVLSRIAKFASFSYPNPYATDAAGRVPLADDKTWEMAQQLLAASDNPERRLDREGLVLYDSYAKTPWLVYDSQSAPWHRNEKMNAFAKRYLGYEKREDKEFIVRAQITLFSIFKYFLHRVWS